MSNTRKIKDKTKRLIKEIWSDHLKLEIRYIKLCLIFFKETGLMKIILLLGVYCFLLL